MELDKAAVNVPEDGFFASALIAEFEEVKPFVQLSFLKGLFRMNLNRISLIAYPVGKISSKK